MSPIPSSVDLNDDDEFWLADLQKILISAVQLPPDAERRHSSEDSRMDRLMVEAEEALSELTKWHVEIRSVLFERENSR